MVYLRRDAGLESGVGAAADDRKVASAFGQALALIADHRWSLERDWQSAEGAFQDSPGRSPRNEIIESDQSLKARDNSRLRQPEPGGKAGCAGARPFPT